MRFWTGFNPWVRRNAGCWDSDKHCWSSACPLRAPVLTEGWLSFAVLFVMSVSLCMLYKHKCPHKYCLIIKLNRRVLFWRVKFRWGWRARRGQHLFERERERQPLRKEEMKLSERRCMHIQIIHAGEKHHSVLISHATFCSYSSKRGISGLIPWNTHVNWLLGWHSCFVKGMCQWVDYLG